MPILIVVMVIPAIYVVGLCFGIDLVKLIISRGREGDFRKIYQQSTNDKERVCDNPACEKLIHVGEQIIRKSRLFGDPEYFHSQCVKIKGGIKSRRVFKR